MIKLDGCIIGYFEGKLYRVYKKNLYKDKRLISRGYNGNDLDTMELKTFEVDDESSFDELIFYSLCCANIEDKEFRIFYIESKKLKDVDIESFIVDKFYTTCLGKVYLIQDNTWYRLVDNDIIKTRKRYKRIVAIDEERYRVKIGSYKYEFYSERLDRTFISRGCIFGGQWIYSYGDSIYYIDYQFKELEKIRYKEVVEIYTDDKVPRFKMIVIKDEYENYLPKFLKVIKLTKDDIYIFDIKINLKDLSIEDYSAKLVGYKDDVMLCFYNHIDDVSSIWTLNED